MKKGILLILLAGFLLLFSSCGQEDSGDSGEWLVPSGQVFDGGPGKDGIPALDNPKFEPISNIDYMSDVDLVLCIKEGPVVRAYTHPILDHHEIVNDEINGNYFSLTYCPLTGTGIGWNRDLDSIGITTFGVSGLLYNTNLMPYDRATNSYWSQQRLDCINGELINQKIETISFVEMSWKTLTESYPDAEILSRNTGIDRDYFRYPYRNYRTDHTYMIFPISTDDARLPRKERVLGVFVNEKAKAFPFPADTINRDVFIDEFENQRLLIVRDIERNVIIAFSNPDPSLEFSITSEALPIILEDNEGNKWDLFGEAIEGPRKGNKLQLADAFMGYWFSWGTFYPGLDIYE